MLKTIFKVLISAFILVALIHGIQWDSLLAYFESLQWPYFFFALLVQFLSSIVAAGRWSLVMKTLGFIAPISFYLRSYFKGLLFNQVLPSSIGGDAYRMIEVNQLKKGKKQAVISVLVDRIYGLLGLVLLLLISFPWVYPMLPLSIANLITALSLLILFSIFFLLCLNIPFFNFLRRKMKLGIILDLAKEFLNSARWGKDLNIKLILAILPNLLTIYSFYLLTKGMLISINFVDYLVIIPIVTLFTMLPLSFAGWGIREGAMVYFGSIIGLLKPEALAVSILFGFISILTGLPGLYLYLFKSKPIEHAYKQKK